MKINQIVEKTAGTWKETANANQKTASSGMSRQSRTFILPMETLIVPQGAEHAHFQGLWHEEPP